MADESEELNSDKKLLSPGDIAFEVVELQSVNGDIINLTNFIIELNIYEDIFSNALQGVILLADSREIISGLPLVGDEILNIWVRTPGFDEGYGQSIKKSFSVYSIKNRILTDDREQVFALHFCSLEAIYDNVTQVSKKFEGTTDEIAKKIWNEYFDLKRGYGTIATDEKTPLVIADTPHETKTAFVANMWSPFRTMNFLAKRSKGKNQKSPSFLFYETSRQFYFTSIDNLIKAQLDNSMIFSEYFYLGKPISPLTGTADDITPVEGFEATRPDLGAGFSTVQEIKFNEQIDILKGQENGRFASVTTIYDIMAKDYINWNWDYGYSYPDTVHMENYDVENGTAKFNGDKDNMTYPVEITRSPFNKQFFRAIHRKVLSDEETLIDYDPGSYLGHRQSIMEDLSGLRMHITVPGRTDAEVGSLIYFRYPKVGEGADKQDEDNRWDPFLSGIWMITAIHHKMTPVRHTMILEIAKDSFANAFQAVSRAPNPNQSADDPEVVDNQADPSQSSSPAAVNKQGWTHPTGKKGRVSSKPGPRQSPGGVGSTNHQGYDIALPLGSPIYAAKDGTVTKAGWQDPGNHKKGYGLRVEIDHGGGYVTRYGHAQEGTLMVKAGDKVKAGQQIMKCDSTGSSTGHHLHFEIRLNGKFQDPGPYIS
jgi:murein DD-endopeptidase MepM/ murein hydrolase activator NlpD